MTWSDHLIIIPIVFPLAAAAATLLLEETRYRLKALIGSATLMVLLAAEVALLLTVDAQGTQVYRLGDWPVPFAIVLVADRLSAMMVLVAGVLGTCAFAFSLARWHRAGPRFHAVFQLLLVGLNGAFLTGDLFNLFVFFELLLAASYGLALYGGGTLRVGASLHYIAVNLTASLVFLVGVSLIYAVTGTLNMADLALRIPGVPAGDRALLEAGAAILAIAFLVKAGMWPLGFWLPGTYAAAAAPAAAVFAILTKVGVYAVLRLSQIFGSGFGSELLLFGGMATLAFGVLGILAARTLSRVAGHSLFVTSGTLLAVIGTGNAAATGAALYYLVASTLGVGALYLLVELLERAREPGADVLAVTAAAFLGIDDDSTPEEEVGVAIPATMAILGASFVFCALLVAGLPPLPGFLAKFSLLAALLDVDPVPPAAWTLLALLTASGLAALIGLGRAGVRIFWPAQERTIPRVRVIEIAPIAALLGLCLALTVAAAPAMRYMLDAAAVLRALPP